MLKYILWDIDNTLLDFDKAELYAMNKCYAQIGVQFTPALLSRYELINQPLWKAFERGEISEEEVVVGRFRTFFTQEGIQADPAEFNLNYQLNLGSYVVERDNSLALCQKLKSEGYLQYIVSNGTAICQDAKLKNSGLDKIMDHVFLSETIGVPKPAHEFFNAVFALAPEIKKEECIIVGDSLTSDMRGGNHAGILCCWYNPKGKSNNTNIKIDFEIRNLWQLESILKTN